MLLEVKAAETPREGLWERVTGEEHRGLWGTGTALCLCQDAGYPVKIRRAYN